MKDSSHTTVAVNPPTPRVAPVNLQTALAELTAIVGALAEQTPNAHPLVPRLARLRATLE